MENMRFYWLPGCSTCKKAKGFIENRGIRHFDLHDIKANPLSRAEIIELTQKLGGANELFSRRAVKYRELKLNERELSERDMLDLMADDYTFLKRPILVCNDRATAGFSEKNWDRFLAENFTK